MNYWWQRLVLSKELFHVILDDESTRHQTVNHLLEDISAHISVDNEDRPKPEKPLQTEFMAEIAAMEFLFPFRERVIKAKSNEIDYSQVAEQYKVPRRFVELYLSQSFMDVLKDFCKN